MDAPPHHNNRIELPDGFEIVTHSRHSEKTEITKSGQKYDLLSAFPDHPYCEKAEDFFHNIFAENGIHEDKATMHLNQKITLYLRNRETFLVEPVIIIADIAEKFAGVRSGIIMSPAEFTGIMCCPPKNQKGTWIAFRSYDTNYLNEINQRKVRDKKTPYTIQPHIRNLPNIRPLKNHAAGLPIGERRNIDFAKLPPNIILAEKELREYFTHTTLCIPPEEEPYWVKEVSKGGDGEGENYYIIYKSPYAWRKLVREAELDFAISTKDDSGKGYFEVARGKVEIKEGKMIFIPEKRGSKPEIMSSQIFKLRPDPAQNTIQTTRNAISDIGHSVV